MFTDPDFDYQKFSGGRETLDQIIFKDWTHQIISFKNSYIGIWLPDRACGIALWCAEIISESDALWWRIHNGNHWAPAPVPWFSAWLMMRSNQSQLGIFWPFTCNSRYWGMSAVQWSVAGADVLLLWHLLPPVARNSMCLWLSFADLLALMLSPICCNLASSQANRGGNVLRSIMFPVLADVCFHSVSDMRDWIASSWARLNAIVIIQYFWLSKAEKSSK